MTDLTTADALLGAAARCGVDICFANPGTTELAVVAALDRQDGVRAVPTLFEGVASGAADGYARMTGTPALTLLHLGPGLANASANLHNARRARTPVVNVVGDHTTSHVTLDSPLTSDIAALAGTTGTVFAPQRADRVVPDFHRAFSAATAAPGGVSTLVVPADLQDAPVGLADHETPTPAPRPTVPSGRVDEVARLLRGTGPAATLLLGGAALSRSTILLAARVAARTGARLLRETFSARVEIGRDLPILPQLPYFPEEAVATLAEVQCLVLVGARAPVGFFGYPGVPGALAAPGTTVGLAEEGEDVAAALEALAEAVAAGPPPRAPRGRAMPSRGPLDATKVGEVVAALVPENGIVTVEGGSAGLPYARAAHGSEPHTALALTGGAIGQGLPVALGAALAEPHRPVIALQSDGSAHYTVQALWTMAREQADVVVVIVANDSYEILRTELGRMGVAPDGPAARALTDLSRPAVAWTSLAASYGVDAVRVATAEELVAALRRGLRTPGPFLIHAAV